MAIRFTKKTREKVIETIRKGGTRLDASAAAEIGEATLFVWLRKGRAERAEGKNNSYTRFVTELEKAEVDALTEMEERYANLNPEKYLQAKLAQKWKRRTDREARLDDKQTEDLMAFGNEPPVIIQLPIKGADDG